MIVSSFQGADKYHRPKYHFTVNGRPCCGMAVGPHIEDRERSDVPEDDLCGRSGCRERFGRPPAHRNHGKPRVPRYVRTVRDLMRQYMREMGLRISGELAQAWDVQGKSALRMMYDRDRPLAPERIEAFIELIQADEIDANELRLAGAKEAGWKIDPKFLIDKM